MTVSKATAEYHVAFYDGYLEGLRAVGKYPGNLLILAEVAAERRAVYVAELEEQK